MNIILSNYNDIIRHSKDLTKEKVHMILNFQYPGENRAVPDPYYNGGFDHVYEVLNKACDHVISKIQYDL